jgi:hypothetical protein
MAEPQFQLDPDKLNTVPRHRIDASVKLMTE